ncbi:4-(cytidine 5'-diphospho)-2-C-methyl-D-erythritol kinase [Arsenicicoccus sp. oral taxon 190]|uniref:4-(cytidine 5'-diphospho)-2-C-methyl-D-erythritol kinase n=1 Tax=Arsenicicoccus sp. oral taxon 190 TaxID=1658671 RepID=UPI00067A3CA1|nr:4-(cytidine 5'-diphospho)-2-C-methyl-D-erythritol kinase [Arsenicicoccus sp. oral taxon 190]AKT50202.1 4-diphosphocytidyl-2C-methyl-D-erythritol kinase [Arsenicicoccus sp. oral taxon 190]
MSRHPSVTVRAAAKVNLELVVGPRDETTGYHELATVFQAVSLYDDVTLVPADSYSLTVTGRGAADVPTDERNLAWRAAARVAQLDSGGGPVGISITKDIPVAGGMAGGSADAAAALVGADALWGTRLDRSTLHGLAADLGADVPFCVLGGTAVGTGRGDELVPAMARGVYHWVFALSDQGLSTPAVFAELDRLRAERGETVAAPQVSQDLMAALLAGDAPAVGRAMRNDLQEAALSLQPGLAETLDIGRECGALGGIVSGSGPTVAFLAESTEQALDVAVALTASGVASDVRRATGPVAGARIVHPGKEQ